MHYLFFDVVANRVVWFGHTVSLPCMSCGNESVHLLNVQTYDMSTNYSNSLMFMHDGVMASIMVAQTGSTFLGNINGGGS